MASENWGDAPAHVIVSVWLAFSSTATMCLGSSPRRSETWALSKSINTDRGMSAAKRDGPPLHCSRVARALLYLPIHCGNGYPLLTALSACPEFLISDIRASLQESGLPHPAQAMNKQNVAFVWVIS